MAVAARPMSPPFLEWLLCETANSSASTAVKFVIWLASLLLMNSFTMLITKKYKCHHDQIPFEYFSIKLNTLPHSSLFMIKFYYYKEITSEMCAEIVCTYRSISKAAIFRFSYSLSFNPRAMLGVKGERSFSVILTAKWTTFVRLPPTEESKTVRRFLTGDHAERTLVPGLFHYPVVLELALCLQGWSRAREDLMPWDKPIGRNRSNFVAKYIRQKAWAIAYNWRSHRMKRWTLFDLSDTFYTFYSLAVLIQLN